MTSSTLTDETNRQPNEQSAVVKRSINYGRLGIAALVALLISSSWLIFPFFIQGQQLLREVGDESRMVKGSNVSRYFTRQLIYHPDLEITATFATTGFFQFVDNADVVGNVRPDRNYIFYVSETIHQGDLGDLAEAALIVGDQRYPATTSDGPRRSQHHRTTVYSFPKRDAEGQLIDIEKAGSVKLEVSNSYLDSEEVYTFGAVWNAPFTVPEELQNGNSMTMVAVLALAAGLLSTVLTPCLLQLVVIFGSIIGGFATVPSQSGASTDYLTPIIRRKVMQIAIAFVFGFTLLYVLAGALIGAIGQQAQLMFAEYSRMIAVISGVIVIALGLWVGLRGSRNFSCKIPNREALQFMTWRDSLGSIVVSMGYALGCTACFGGAIIATLIVYVGSLGSATEGALMMLTFSIGVAIPFLLAAWYVSRMDSVLVFLAQKAQFLSYLCMALIVAFGLILVTDNFHQLSDIIYPLLMFN